MIRDKRDLLTCAENTSYYINNIGGGSFIPFILDIIDFLNNQDIDEEKKTEQLWEILYNVKNSNIDVLGGGKALKESYIHFVDDFLKISKVNNSYKTSNDNFADLSINELYYVFAWVRRLTKDREVSKREKKSRHRAKPNANVHKSKKYGKNKNTENSINKGFNSQLFDQLKDLKVD